MRKFLLLAGAALALGLPQAAYSQSQANTAAESPQARRDQLAKVQEMLSDPDPLMRLANMEAIVNSGDALRIQLALRIAFASDDAELRGLAMRAYLGTHHEITFDIALPPAIQKQYDEAKPSATQELIRQYPYLSSLANAAFRFQLTVSDYTLGQDNGKIQADRAPAPFVITGDKLSTLVVIGAYGNCYVDFWPSQKQTFQGTLACIGGWPKLAISAPTF